MRIRVKIAKTKKNSRELNLNSCTLGFRVWNMNVLLFIIFDRFSIFLGIPPISVVLHTNN